MDTTELSAQRDAVLFDAINAWRPDRPREPGYVQLERLRSGLEGAGAPSNTLPRTGRCRTPAACAEVGRRRVDVSPIGQLGCARGHHLAEAVARPQSIRQFAQTDVASV
jgi:hypothetical protein